MNILMENTSIIYELFIQHLEEETNFLRRELMSEKIYLLKMNVIVRIL